MASNTSIPVDCAVNDDHGNLDCRISAIAFPGLELEVVDLGGLRFREMPSAERGEFRIKIGRCEYACTPLAHCVGNIYWNRYGMEPWTAAHCLHRLRGARAFTLDVGYEELARWWDTSVEDHAYVRRLLMEAAKDDAL